MLFYFCTMLTRYVDSNILPFCVCLDIDVLVRLAYASFWVCVRCKEVRSIIFTLHVSFAQMLGMACASFFV